jgi:hypothetical protein
MMNFKFLNSYSRFSCQLKGDKAMKKILVFVCAIVFLFGIVENASAFTLVEDFEAPFPSWESGWLGTNSDLGNYYGVGAGRGNNPDGLWISNSTITFDTIFGTSITSLSFDVASWRYHNVEIYDIRNILLYSTGQIAPNYGAYSDPGTYDNHSVSSINGISKFVFVGSGIVGNTSIDNVVVSKVPVHPNPEPATMLLLGSGLICLVGLRRKFRKK